MTNGEALWANLALLLCLSLFPFMTAWMDQSRFAQTPVVTYALNLLIAATGYLALQTVMIRQHGPDSPLRQAGGTDMRSSGQSSGPMTRLPDRDHAGCGGCTPPIPSSGPGR